MNRISTNADAPRVRGRLLNAFEAMYGRAPTTIQAALVGSSIGSLGTIASLSSPEVGAVGVVLSGLIGGMLVVCGAVTDWAVGRFTQPRAD
jgi:hypothetical protein